MSVKIGINGYVFSPPRFAVAISHILFSFVCCHKLEFRNRVGVSLNRFRFPVAVPGLPSVSTGTLLCRRLIDVTSTPAVMAAPNNGGICHSNRAAEPIAMSLPPLIVWLADNCGAQDAILRAVIFFEIS